MTRLDVACVCIDKGIHVGLTVTGQHRDQLIQAFRDEHTGPGHLPISPAKDWYGKEAEFKRYLAKLRKGMTALGNTDDVTYAHPTRDVDPGNRL